MHTENKREVRIYGRASRYIAAIERTYRYLRFNKDTLSKYLGLPSAGVESAEGNLDFLADEPNYRFKLFDKIMFLYMSAKEDKDLKLSAFLKVLISHHNLSKATIAKMAGVEVNDIDKILAYPQKSVSEEIKYKTAVTVMSLRFFLKDSEPKL